MARKSYDRWDWSILDKELLDMCKFDIAGSSVVKKFSQKYNMPIATIHSRLRRNLKIKLKYKGSERKEKHPCWKGGKYISKEGYVMMYVGIRNGVSIYVGEHIIVMENHLGRKLKRLERVHHIDESFKGRSNNSISNLQLMTHSEHIKHHHKYNKIHMEFSV